MPRLLHYMVCICMLLVSPLLAQAQVLAKATLDRDSILIGEPLTLSLDVRTPLGQSISWFNLDTIPHFEFIKKGKVDTTDGIDGKAIQQVLTITSFDSGYWAIPPLAIRIGDKTYYTDSVPVKVAWLPFNAADDYRDIKDILDVPPPAWLRYVPWLLALATLAAAAGIYYLLRKKKAPVLVQQEPALLLSPYEEALQALDELRNKGWMQNGQLKNFYSRLNDILRVFVWRRLHITSLEKTNDELILQLRQLTIEKHTFHELVSALRVADFVKFAKYQPDAEENEKNMAIIRTAITSLNNMGER